MTRSRRAGLSRDEARQQPLYARMLGLQYLAPSGFLCFVFLEGAVALGILLALAELVSWWGVLVLPVTVAAMVKLNDVVAGALTRPAVRVSAAPAAPGRRPPTSVAGSSGAQTVRLPPSVITRVGGGSPPGDSPALRPAALRQGTETVVREDDRWTPPPMGALDANALNGPPAARQWAEQLDDRQQRARQSGAWHYE